MSDAMGLMDSMEKPIPVGRVRCPICPDFGYRANGERCDFCDGEGTVPVHGGPYPLPVGAGKAEAHADPMPRMKKISRRRPWGMIG